MSIQLALKEYQASYRAQHKEKMKEYAARYYLENKEKLKERSRIQGAKNPEKRKARAKKWRVDNLELAKFRSREWNEARKNDPEYKARKLANQRKRDSTPEGRIKRCLLAKENRRKFPERVRKNAKDWHYRTKYGITVAERDQIFEQQGKRCRICRRNSSSGRGFHVDHCHITKKIRGILCHHCNLMLGNSQDNIATLEAAIVYLKGN